MGNPVSIGLSGLMAAQRAIATVGNNIANVNTPGYSKQLVVLTPLESQRVGGGFVGKGVTIAGLSRANATFANEQIRTNTASVGENAIFYEEAVELDKLLIEKGSSLN